MATAPKALPPTYFFVTVAVTVLAHVLLPAHRWLNPPFTYAGVLPALLGLVLVLQPAAVFEKRDTTIKPFQESTALVTDGFYRYTRNPMYLGMALLLVGLAMFLGTVWPAFAPPVFAWVLTQRFIRAEEASLLRAFGTEYEEYRRRVRRWL